MNSTNTDLPQIDDALRGILRACLACEKDPQGTFSGKWVRQCCERAGIPFRPGWLTTLVNLGLLEKLDATHGGNRRYYRIANAALVEEVLSLAGSVS